jgi:hypothetical protein
MSAPPVRRPPGSGRGMAGRAQAPASAVAGPGFGWAANLARRRALQPHPPTFSLGGRPGPRGRP